MTIEGSPSPDGELFTGRDRKSPAAEVYADRQALSAHTPALLRALPLRLRLSLNGLYWRCYEARDFVAEASGWVPSHFLRLFLYRRLLGARIGPHTSIHRNCRLYRPPGIAIGAHCIINRDILLDGRSGLHIGDNVSISEGTAVFTLDHDPASSEFAGRGAPVRIEDRVFIGARVLILPGVTIRQGAVVAAGAVVTRDVEAYTIVAGVPARIIGARPRDLTYTLDYRKFLG